MGTCYVTGSTENVEPHHIFGASDKALSEKYGFMLPLRRDWHRGTGYSIHGDAAFSLAMKVRCQEYYVGVLGKSVREWQGEFRKWYTEGGEKGKMGAGIKEGTEVYGILMDADGLFVSRGTVTRAGEDGFEAGYRETPCVRYTYGDIGSTVFTEKGDALRRAEDACEDRRQAQREDFAERNAGGMP